MKRILKYRYYLSLIIGIILIFCNIDNNTICSLILWSIGITICFYSVCAIILTNTNLYD